MHAMLMDVMLILEQITIAFATGTIPEEQFVDVYVNTENHSKITQ